MAPYIAGRLPEGLSHQVADRLGLAFYRCRWNRRRPRTFNEKLMWKMVWDRRPILVTFADKVACSEYLAQRIGSGYTPKQYALTKDLASVDRSRLPANYVVKNSHLSGGVVVVFDGADSEEVLQAPGDVYARRVVRPENLDWHGLVDVSEACLWTTYINSIQPCGEWMYGPAPRRVVVEELVRGPDGGLPDDLRFFVFNGTCGMIVLSREVVNIGATQRMREAEWERVRHA